MELHNKHWQSTGGCYYYIGLTKKMKYDNTFCHSLRFPHSLNLKNFWYGQRCLSQWLLTLLHCLRSRNCRCGICWGTRCRLSPVILSMPKRSNSSRRLCGHDPEHVYLRLFADTDGSNILTSYTHGAYCCPSLQGLKLRSEKWCWPLKTCASQTGIKLWTSVYFAYIYIGMVHLEARICHLYGVAQIEKIANSWNWS